MPDKLENTQEELLSQSSQLEADLNRIETDLGETKNKIEKLGIKLNAYLQAVNEHLKKFEEK